MTPEFIGDTHTHTTRSLSLSLLQMRVWIVNATAKKKKSERTSASAREEKAIAVHVCAVALYTYIASRKLWCCPTLWFPSSPSFLRKRGRDIFYEKVCNTQRALHGNVVTYYVRRQINRVRELLLIYLLHFFFLKITGLTGRELLLLAWEMRLAYNLPHA